MHYKAKRASLRIFKHRPRGFPIFSSDQTLRRPHSRLKRNSTLLKMASHLVCVPPSFSLTYWSYSSVGEHIWDRAGPCQLLFLLQGLTYSSSSTRHLPRSRLALADMGIGVHASTYVPLSPKQFYCPMSTTILRTTLSANCRNKSCKKVSMRCMRTCIVS